MKLNAKLGGRLSPRQTHGYKVLKSGVRALSTRVVDRRTRIGRALDEWRRELLADLGGPENISTQEAALIEEAVLTKLILSSINAWMLDQGSLVSGRNRGVLPVVLHRNALVSTLRQLLADLGLKRRRSETLSITDITREYAHTSVEENATASASRRSGDSGDTGDTGDTATIRPIQQGVSAVNGVPDALPPVGTRGDNSSSATVEDSDP